MSLRQFVSICSVVLVAWLAVTFVHEMPDPRGPVQESQSKSHGIKGATVDAGIGSTEDLAVSVSH